MAPLQTLLRPDPTAPAAPARAGMTPRTLRAFFALAFGLGWGVLAVLILFTTQIKALSSSSRRSCRRCRLVRTARTACHAGPPVGSGVA